jgi:Ca-activated chloride channel family protein
MPFRQLARRPLTSRLVVGSLAAALGLTAAVLITGCESTNTPPPSASAMYARGSTGSFASSITLPPVADELWFVPADAPVGVTEDPRDALDVIGAQTGFGAIVSGEPELAERTLSFPWRRNADAEAIRAAISERLTRVAELRARGEHQQALTVVDEILFLDEDQPTARRLRPELERLALQEWSGEARRAIAGLDPAERACGAGEATQMVVDRIAAGDRDFGVGHLPAPPADGLTEPGLVGRIVLAESTRERAPRWIRRPFLMPLAGTRIEGRVDGMIADVDIVQRYHNPASVPIEATYVFPLPDRAAVRDFVMTIGSRTIRGIVRDRDEAERLYARAVAAGHTASLMRQDRPNLFTQRVGNIPPHEAIDLRLTYLDEPTLEDGWLELAVPLAVKPRYRPAGSPAGVPSSAGVRAAASGPGGSAPAVQLDLTVHADSGIAGVAAGHPEILASREHAGAVRFRTDAGGIRLDRDLRLRWQVAIDRPRTIVASHWDGAQGWFVAQLVPPSLDAALIATPTTPRSVVLLLDVSGSMEGPMLELMRLAAAGIVDALGPDDRFDLVAFANAPTPFLNGLVRTSPDRRRAAGQWLAALRAEGGTEMEPALRMAYRIAGDADPDRDTAVILLSDALTSAEDTLIARADRGGGVRLHAIGIGDAPNRFLVDRLAAAGGGLATVIPLGADATVAGRRLAQRTAATILRDLRISADPDAVQDLILPRGHDLVPGRPVTIIGRYPLPGRHRIWLEGTGPRGVETIPVDLELAGVAGPDALPAAWARAQIAGWEREHAAARSDRVRGALREQIRDTALAFGLASRDTSFVAVDAASRTGWPPAHSVTQIAPVARDMTRPGPIGAGPDAAGWWTDGSPEGDG